MDEKLTPTAALTAGASMGNGMVEGGELSGVFSMEHWRDGKLLHAEDFNNTVVTVGKNNALESTLAASALTTVGPFMGLISSVSYTGIAAGDIMASHGGWTEAGVTNAPTYTIPRKTITFSAASGGSKASNGTYTFAFTGSGTAKGAFLVLGTGAVSTIDNTAGTLYSAGLFSIDRIVISGDTITVTYTASM